MFNVKVYLLASVIGGRPPKNVMKVFKDDLVSAPFFPAQLLLERPSHICTRTVALLTMQAGARACATSQRSV